MRSTAYAFSGAPAVTDQLDALTEALDPYTRAGLTDLVRPGQQVLEIGSGSGTIATWLSEQVGPTGHVTATDLDISRITGGPNLTVRPHDLTRDRLAADSYDLVHGRLVLLHLTARHGIVADLAAALRPAGALVLHEFDCTWHRTVHAASASDTALFHQVGDAINRILQIAGARLDWGMAAHRAMTDAGLINVSTDVHAQTFRGGEPWARLAAINTIQLERQLLDLGLSTDQLHHYRDLMTDPAFVATSYLTTRTIGLRPA